MIQMVLKLSATCTKVKSISQVQTDLVESYPEVKNLTCTLVTSSLLMNIKTLQVNMQVKVRGIISLKMNQFSTQVFTVTGMTLRPSRINSNLKVSIQPMSIYGKLYTKVDHMATRAKQRRSMIPI